MSEEQTQADQANWRESIPEPLRDAPYFKNAETMDQVLADIKGAAAWQGNSIRIPGPDSTDEQRAEFITRAQEKIPGLMAVPEVGSDDYSKVMAKLGMPEEAGAYHVPEQVEIDGELLGNLKAEAFAAGLTQSQFQSLVAKQAEGLKTQTEINQAKISEQQALLKNEWGEAAEQRLGAVEHLLSDGPQLLRDAFEANSLDAATVQWLYGMAEQMTEGNEGLRQVDGQNAVMSPGEAAHQEAEIFAQLQQLTPTDPRYRELVQRRVDLIRATGG